MLFWYWDRETDELKQVPEGLLPSWSGENNRVALTMLNDGKWVSTVFLGIDHQFEEGGGPILFETMVFDAAHQSLDCCRYHTPAGARAGHKLMVSQWQVGYLHGLWQRFWRWVCDRW